MSLEKSSYRTGELAELTGVSTDTLRHYERKGVLETGTAEWRIVLQENKPVCLNRSPPVALAP